jgi:drug/metabolite transporter, DME family
MSSRIAAVRFGLLQICLAATLWGTGGLAVELIRERVPLSPLTISAYRMAGAAAILIIALLALNVLKELRVSGRVIATGVATAGYQTLYFIAVTAVGVTVATVVSLGTAPILMTGGEAMAHRTRPSVKQLTVLTIALAGLVLVTGFAGQGATGPQPFAGVLLAVASGALFAVATALGRPLAQSFRPMVLTTATTTVGGLSLLPFCVWIGFSGGPLLTDDPVVVSWLVYLAVATMALAYALLYAGLRTCRGSAATTATLLEPATASIAAAGVLGERLTTGGLVGTALILVAIVGLGG